MTEETKIPLGMDNEAGSWPEDFAHENGNYQCRCICCNDLFMGHKRRVVCRVCDVPSFREELDT